jgi:ribosomal protein L9
MKVILLTDIPKVGNKYDVKDLRTFFINDTRFLKQFSNV